MLRLMSTRATSAVERIDAFFDKLLLLRALLGLERIGEHLLVDSALPEQIGWLQILDIPGRWRRTDAFGRGLGARR
jgi:hypothetical protein